MATKKYTALNVDPSAAPAGYESQWLNNPYATFEYNHTGMQKLWEHLGFRSKFDEYKDSMAMNAMEYQSQLLDKAHNEEYDSAAAQAQRERAAGLNPDLAGNVAPGESSSMPNDPNAPISPGFNDPAPVLQAFGNVILGGLSSAIGLAGDAMSLFKMKNDIDAGQFVNSKGILDWAFEAASQFVPNSNEPEMFNNAQELASEIATPFLSRKRARQFKNALGAFYQSAPKTAEQYAMWKKGLENRRDFAVTSASEFSASDEVLSIVAKRVAEANDRVYKYSSEAAAKGAENEMKYQSEVDGSLAGQVENMGNESALAGKHIDSILNSCFDDILSDLRSFAKSDKRGAGFANAAILVLSILRMQNITPKVSFNSHSSNNSAQNIIQN